MSWRLGPLSGDLPMLSNRVSRLTFWPAACFWIALARAIASSNEAAGNKGVRRVRLVSGGDFFAAIGYPGNLTLTYAAQHSAAVEVPRNGITSRAVRCCALLSTTSRVVTTGNGRSAQADSGCSQGMRDAARTMPRCRLTMLGGHSGDRALSTLTAIDHELGRRALLRPMPLRARPDSGTTIRSRNNTRCNWPLEYTGRKGLVWSKPGRSSHSDIHSVCRRVSRPFRELTSALPSMLQS